jgi:hypothetical protein
VISQAVEATVGLAEILFRIGPFRAEEAVENWPALLGGWLQGNALSEFADNDGVSFIQGDVVFRLVWGVEAARLHLSQLSMSAAPESDGILALCLTYGVPNKRSGLFMQAGMSSRTLSCKCADFAGPVFHDLGGLKSWVFAVLQGDEPSPQWTEADDKAEWTRFLQRFDHRDYADWRLRQFVLPIKWNFQAPKAGTRVRITFEDGDISATVLSVYLARLGSSIIPEGLKLTRHFFGIVRTDQQSVDVSFFGA